MYFSFYFFLFSSTIQHFFPDLPIMSTPPKVTAIHSSTVTVAWSAWTPGVDVGDGPVVSYKVYIKESNIWQERTVMGHATRVILDGLEPDTNYGISVAAVREGIGGTGPRSAVTNITTLCAGKTN